MCQQCCHQSLFLYILLLLYFCPTYPQHHLQQEKGVRRTDDDAVQKAIGIHPLRSLRDRHKHEHERSKKSDKKIRGITMEEEKSIIKNGEKKKEAFTNLMYGGLVEHFYNEGRLKGWDFYHHEKDGRIKEIENAERCFQNGKTEDDHCLSFQQTYDETYDGRYHTEVIMYRAATHHQAAYYGMAFKLDETYVFDEPWKKREKAENIKMHLMQFIASFKDMDCGSHQKTAVPTTMVWLENDDIFTKVRSGDICRDRHNIKDFWIGKAVPGTWHTIVIGAHWHKESREGWFKVWFDKHVMVDERELRTFPDIDNRMFEMRVGLYPNWYTWDGKGHPFIAPGHQRTKKIYIDEVGFGPTFEDADPWSNKKHK